MAPLHKLKVLEQCRILPTPPPSASAGAASRPSSLPLTFFDLVFVNFHPVQRLFFYELPGLAVADFLASELPRLKRSLSLTLHHFYPLAGTLTRDEIVCSEGDSVQLTVAASADDFRDVIGDHPRCVRRFHPLVPELNSRLGDKGPCRDVLAVQVTVFPGAGVSVGTALQHAAADGASYVHFMKSWAGMHRTGSTPPTQPPPLFDRSVVRDPRGLRAAFAKEAAALEGDRRMEAWDVARGAADAVRATFAFGRSRLRALAAARRAPPGASPYALACGFAWAGVARARGGGGERLMRFGFVTGCRARVEPEIPGRYFGNCLGICAVEARRSELAGEDGAGEGARAIWKGIEGLSSSDNGEEGVMGEGMRGWVRRVYECAGERAVTVAGSPKLGAYGVDFGWGPPAKVEIVSSERTGALALAEGRDGDGGIEVGVVLPRREMDAFVAFFASQLGHL